MIVSQGRGAHPGLRVRPRKVKPGMTVEHEDKYVVVTKVERTTAILTDDPVIKVHYMGRYDIKRSFTVDPQDWVIIRQGT